MQALRLFILYRFPLGILLAIIAVVFGVMGDWGMGIFTFILAAVCIATHLLFGTLRLVQESVVQGNMDEAMKYLNMIRYPNLLIKPVRQGYHMIQSQLAMASQDFASAEAHIQKSIESKNTFTKDYDGMSYFQLGMIAAQKKDSKNAKINLKKALELGLQDNDATSMAYLQLCSIEMQARQFRVATDLFRKAKACKPQNSEIKAQIAEIEKYISRLPKQ